MKITLNYKIPTMFQNLKNYNASLIIQEVGKLNFKINIVPNRIAKYVNLILHEKLVFIDSFQFITFFNRQISQKFR